MAKRKKKKNPEKLVAKLFCRFGEIHDNHDNAWDILGGVEISAFLLRKMIFFPFFLGPRLKLSPKDCLGFFGGSDDKESACNVGDAGLLPGLGRSPGEGNGDPLQYSCLGNSMDRGVWWVIVHGVVKSWTQWWLNNNKDFLEENILLGIWLILESYVFGRGPRSSWVRISTLDSEVFLSLRVSLSL